MKSRLALPACFPRGSVSVSVSVSLGWTMRRCDSDGPKRGEHATYTLALSPYSVAKRCVSSKPCMYSVS